MILNLYSRLLFLLLCNLQFFVQDMPVNKKVLAVTKKKPDRSKKVAKKKIPSLRKLCLYRTSKVKQALVAVQKGMSLSQASKKYFVPRTTLRRRVLGEVATSRSVGPMPILGIQNEEKISEWLINLSRMGIPIDKDCLLHSVKKLIEVLRIETPFKNNLAGRKWFVGFMKRHPNLSKKKAEYLSKSRAAVPETKIRKWFSDLQELWGDQANVLQHPDRVLNMDETSICRAPKWKNEICPKDEGSKTLYYTKKSEWKH